jgi:hypothetical protein
MDRACEGDESRQLALDLGMIPAIPPQSNRLDPCEHALICAMVDFWRNLACFCFIAWC